MSVSRKLKKMFALLNRVQLQDPDEDDDEDRCSIVVSLMRIDRKRTPATEKPPIGFAIYKVKTHSRKIGFLKYGLPIFFNRFFFNNFWVGIIQIVTVCSLIKCVLLLF